jgi:hypothetical protein
MNPPLALVPRGAVLLAPPLGVASLAFHPKLFFTSLTLALDPLLVSAADERVDLYLDLLRVGYVHIASPFIDLGEFIFIGEDRSKGGVGPQRRGPPPYCGGCSQIKQLLAPMLMHPM